MEGYRTSRFQLLVSVSFHGPARLLSACINGLWRFLDDCMDRAGRPRRAPHSHLRRPAAPSLLPLRRRPAAIRPRRPCATAARRRAGTLSGTGRFPGRDAFRAGALSPAPFPRVDCACPAPSPPPPPPSLPLVASCPCPASAAPAPTVNVRTLEAIEVLAVCRRCFGDDWIDGVYPRPPPTPRPLSTAPARSGLRSPDEVLLERRLG